MKNRCVASTAFIVVFTLFLQIGCQVSPVPPAPAPEPVKAEPTAPPMPLAPAAPAAPVTPEQAKPQLPSEEQLPKITFENTVHDFGEITPNSKNNCEFKFTNTGSALLKIGKIYASCGCTVPQLSKEEYAPGESGSITVEFHPGAQSGQQSRKLDVPTNDKANQKVILVIKAKVVVKIEYEPKKLVFSLKNDPNSQPPRVKITSVDSQPFAISGFTSHPEGISIDYDPAVQKAEFVVEPKIDLEKLQKNLQGYIKINLTYPGYDSISIPFSVMPRFRVSPPAIVLLDAKHQEPVEREITVLNNYGEHFEIESASSLKSIIKVIGHEKVGDRYKIKVSITPPTVADNPRMFTDTLFINIKGGGKLEVACRGFYPTSTENIKP